MHRRKFIQLLLSGYVAVQTTPLSAFAADPGKKKIIWVLLRGGMDSLHTVIPLSDPHLMQYRADIVQPIRDEILPLDNGFGLHPSLSSVYEWYKQDQCIPVVAVASPYRSRSHFDGQDFLESGYTKIDHDSGWLARSLALYGGSGIAISRTLPISLRGYGAASTWLPSPFPEADDNLHDLLVDLYSDDPQLSKSLDKGLRTRESMENSRSKAKKIRFEQLARICTEFMVKNPSTSCAMLELGGWDTHNNQQTRLRRQLKMLNNGLTILKQGLGPLWDDTVIIVATEFGRTVAMNGTRGTDHGTASALLLTGGAVAGGRVAGVWPGLQKDLLYKQRDLMPTSDIRSWLGAIVQQHWGITSQKMVSVFPGIKSSSEKLVRGQEV